VIDFANKLNIESALNKSSEIVNNYFTSALFGQIDYLVKNNIKKISFAGFGYRSNTGCVEGSVSLKLIDYCLENNCEVLLYDFYIKETYKNLKKYLHFEQLLLKSDIIFLPYKDKKFNQLLNFNKKNIIVLDFFSQFDNNNNNNNNIKITNNLKNVDLDFIKMRYTENYNSKVVHLKK
jgi:UDP-glucose 6-dehydrogenase